MNLKEKAKALPSSPGVYLMKDASNQIIYVGKSKNLKSRVQSYLYHSANHTKKVEKLVKQLKDFDTILTDTEFEALLLECQLIKEIKPFYNRLMKSPQAYSYIVVHRNEELPRIEMTYEIEEDDNLYFGPYTSKNSIETAISGLKDFFKLQCSHGTKKNSPCLNYSLGLCIGVCFDEKARARYRDIINRIISLLEGKDRSILKEMEQEMMEAAGNIDFEKAAKIRDWMDAIQSLLKKEKIIEFTKENQHIVVIEFVDCSHVKQFLINRNTVLFNKMVELDGANLLSLCENMTLHLTSHLKTDIVNVPMNIRKEEIDEAQIIYRYLQSNDCEYLILPKQQKDIEKAVYEFLYTKLAERQYLMKEKPENLS